MSTDKFNARADTGSCLNNKNLNQATLSEEIADSNGANFSIASICLSLFCIASRFLIS